MTNQYTKVFTDGSCDRDRVGGYGAILIHGKATHEVSGAMTNTTSNAMELMAIIQALQAFKRPAHISIFTDSTYVYETMTKYIDMWIDNHMRKRGAQIPNTDLWLKLKELCDSHEEIKWNHEPRDSKWIAHAHELANDARRAQRQSEGLSV